MDAHGGACRIGILAHDGGIDLLVLAVHPAQIVGIACRRMHGGDAIARNQQRPEMLQDVLKIPVACGLRDAQVKGQIMLDGVVPQGEMMLELLQSLAHDLQMDFAAALGSQTGSLGLQTDAQLQHGQHIDGLAELARAEHGACALTRGQHKRAYAMAGLDQPRRLQFGQGFAHHGAADVIAAHEFGLGGQLVPLMQQALADLVLELLGQQIRQTAAALAGFAAQRVPLRQRQRRG